MQIACEPLLLPTLDLEPMKCDKKQNKKENERSMF